MQPYTKSTTTSVSSEDQYNLGRRHQKDTKVLDNLEIAIKFFESAANQGHVKAHVRLADIYFDKANEEKYVKFYKLASDLGDIYATTRVAICYSNGLGVQKNAKEAMKYTVLAADRGDRYSQMLAGGCFKHGTHGFEKNVAKSVKYFKLAQEQPADAVYRGGSGQRAADPLIVLKLFFSAEITEEDSLNQ